MGARVVVVLSLREGVEDAFMFLKKQKQAWLAPSLFIRPVFKIATFLTQAMFGSPTYTVLVLWMQHCFSPNQAHPKRQWYHLDLGSLSCAIIYFQFVFSCCFSGHFSSSKFWFSCSWIVMHFIYVYCTSILTLNQENFSCFKHVLRISDSQMHRVGCPTEFNHN